jgi:2-polyprenyl-3-methyl-5-hydroxy-6-metoxy-1,4-benzoquinol methylase
MFDRLLPESSQVVGFDIGEDEIRTASAWAVENRPSSRYVLGGVDEIPVEDGWADLTIASEVIEHLSEEEVGPFLGAARRLTRPDGRVVVTVPNVRQLRNRARRLVGRPPVFMDPDHDREYTLETAREAIESSGLTIEEVRGAVLYGPFERVAQKVIPADSPLRTGAADRWPRVASHLIFVCRP